MILTEGWTELAGFLEEALRTKNSKKEDDIVKKRTKGPVGDLTKEEWNFYQAQFRHLADVIELLKNFRADARGRKGRNKNKLEPIISYLHKHAKYTLRQIKIFETRHKIPENRRIKWLKNLNPTRECSLSRVRLAEMLISECETAAFLLDANEVLPAQHLADSLPEILKALPKRERDALRPNARNLQRKLKTYKAARKH